MEERIVNINEVIAGDIIETRRGERYLVTGIPREGFIRDGVMLLGVEGFMQLSSFGPDLKLIPMSGRPIAYDDFDIMKVYRGFTMWGLGFEKGINRDTLENQSKVVFDRRRDTFEVPEENVTNTVTVMVGGKQYTVKADEVGIIHHILSGYEVEEEDDEEDLY